MIPINLTRALLLGVLALFLCFPLGLPHQEHNGISPLLAALLVMAAALLGGTFSGSVTALPWRRWLHSMALWILPAICVMLPLIPPLGNFYILDAMTLIFIIALGALGLNVAVGQAGLMNTGFAGLYAIGAYTSGLLFQYFGLSFWATIVPSIVVTSAVGALMALPVLRLRGDYLAVVTLGFAEILRIILINATSVTNGAAGIIGIRKPDFFGMAVFAPFSKYNLPTFSEWFDITFSPLHQKLFFYYVALLALALTALVVHYLRRSAYGRQVEAMREDAIACDALGIDRGKLMVRTFAISGAIGGLAGCLFAARQGFINPDSFTFNDSVLFLAVAVLAGTNPLAILPAACIAVGLPEIFRDLAAWRMPMFGIALIALIILCPRGLSGTRQPSARWRGTRL